MQRAAETNSADDPVQRQEAASAKDSGPGGLPRDLQTGVEQLSGTALDDVRVHHNSSAPAQLGAYAYAQGRDIHLGPGQEKHLPHEAWHVVQQAQGRVQPTLQAKGVAINDDPGLEAEADAMGAKALSVNASDAQPAQRKAHAPGDGSTIQGRFGFEIEVPIFFSKDGGNGRREDPGGAVLPQGAFDIKVDHNEELQPLAHYANINQNNSTDGFSHGPSIIEIVTKPWDEFVLSETDVRDRAENITHWVDNVYAAAKDGESRLGGDYFVGSDSPRRTLQSTLGYFQTTYGIKLSRVPDMFTKTAIKSVENESDNKDIIGQLSKAGAIGPAVVADLKTKKTASGAKLEDVASEAELAALAGFTSLMANYLLADDALEGGVGLGKNLIGDYFYKSDLGAVADVLPASVRDALRQHVPLVKAYATLLANQCGKAPDHDLNVGAPLGAWVRRVVGGGSDMYLSGLINEDSVEIDPERIGAHGDKEAAVIMENREPQNLDPDSKQKRKDGKAEQDAFYSGGKKTPDQLKDFLRTMTDPKKYPKGEWANMMVKVYKILNEING